MIINGIIYRYRTGIPWRDLPREKYGPWQTVWKRHRSYARRGVCDYVLAQVVAQADEAGKVDWTVSIDATINRAHQRATNTMRPDQDTGGASSSYKNSPLGENEPAGHRIGRSRGGPTTRIHQVVDGNGRPLAMVVTGGQRNDGAMMQVALEDIYVPRPIGRPRTTPDTVMADRGYTSGANQRNLRDHHVKAVIPQKKNEIASRKKKGTKGGRPPAFDQVAYKGRNVVERSCPASSSGVHWPPGMTNWPSPTGPPPSSMRPLNGSGYWRQA